MGSMKRSKMPVVQGGFCVVLLAAVAAWQIGCTHDGGGGSGGGGAVTILPANDGNLTGFLWKPRSESNGDLVVLMPPEFTGQVSSGNLHTSENANDGNLVEAGRFAGDTHNGNRAHWRFNMRGGSYGQVWFVATLNDGSRRAWFIENGA